MPAITPLVRLVFHNFKDNLPRVPVTFFNKDGKKLPVDDVILDSGANYFVIPKYIYDFLDIKSTKNEIASTAGGKTKSYMLEGVTFIIGYEDKYVVYENEKIYCSPLIEKPSLGTVPIFFRDFVVTIDAKNKTTILEPR